MFVLKSQRSRGGLTVSLVLLLAAAATATVLFLNRQAVVDQLTVWQYGPSAEVSALAEKTDMSRRGTFYFYSGQPAIETAPQFKQSCARQEKSAAILGCYSGGLIYIYDVTDERLAGIREVTAAHEMLHAAYVRLPSSERNRVDRLVEVEYQKLKNSKSFSERVAYYDRTEPGERYNELHSMIGTEIAQISTELEAYYRTYFTDRSKVIGLHDSYASVFNNLEQRGAQLQAQLSQLSTKITNDSDSYAERVAQLNRAIASFNSRAESGGFSTQSQFDAERRSLLAQIDASSTLRDGINQDVAAHDALRLELESASTQVAELNRSININLAPVPSV